MMMHGYAESKLEVVPSYMKSAGVQRAPRVSAVIIAHNEEERIGECLRSVRALAEEIVLVDDHSTDRTIEIARLFDARVLTRSFDSAARQMNFGIQAARGRWIL